MKKPWRHIIIGSGLLLGLCVLFIFSLVFYLHTHHAQTLGKRFINRHLPGTVSWNDFKPAFIKGSILLQQFRLEGPDGKKILAVDKLALDWSWRHLLRGELVLEGEMDKPWIHLRRNPNGRLNITQALPKKSEPAPEDNPGTPFPLNLVVKSFRLTDGSLTYEAESDRISININGIDSTIKGNVEEENADIVLQIAGGDLAVSDFKTLLKPSKVSGRYADNRLSPIKISVITTAGDATLTGSIDQPLTSPQGDIKIHAKAFLENILPTSDPATAFGGIAQANIHLKGPLGNPNADLTLTYEDKARKQQTFNKPTIHRADARAILSNRLLTIDRLMISSGNSQAAIQGTVDLKPAFVNGFLTSTPNFEATKLDGHFSIETPDLAASLTPWGVRGANGSLSAEGTVSGIISRPQFNLHLEGKQLAYGDVHLGNLGLAGTLGSNGRLRLETVTIDNQGSIIKGQGDLQVFTPTRAIQENPFVNFRLTLTDVEPQDFVNQELADSLFSGYLDGTVVLGGHIKDPQIRIDLNGRDIHIKDIPLGEIAADVTYQNGDVVMRSVKLTKGPTQATISGNANLIDPTTLNMLANPALDLTISGKKIDLSDYLPDWYGQVSFDARLKGPLKDCHGPIQLTGSQIVSPWQSLEKLSLTAFLEGDILNVNELTLSPAPNEWVRLTGGLSLRQMSDVHITSNGITLSHIDWLKEKIPIEGKLAVSVKGNGPFKNPIANGTVSLKGVTVDQIPVSDLQGTIGISDSKASFDLKNDDTSASGTYHLTRKILSTAVLIHVDDLKPYFALFELPDFAGRVKGELNIEGNPQNPDKLTILGALAEARLDYKGKKLVQTQDAQLAYENGRFNIPGWEVALLDKGRIYIKGAGRPGSDMDLMIEGNLPLAVGRTLSPTLHDLSGNLKLSASVKGNWAQPEIKGDLFIESGALTLPAWGGKLHGVNGRAILKPNTITIPSLDGYLDEGRFRLDGTLALDHFRPGELRLDLSTQNVPIRVPGQLDLFINSQLNLKGQPDRTRLSGNINLLDGVYYQDILLNPMDMLKPKKKRPTELEKEAITSPYIKNLNLDVAVSSRQPFQVQNNMAQLDLIPDLTIEGTLNRPDLTGQTDISKGTIRLWNRQFKVTRGSVDFVDPGSLRPGIDFRATATIRQWEIFIDVTGPMDDLQLKLSSNPIEQSGDILALILTGRTSREMAAGESGKTGTTGAALAAIAGTPLGDRLKKAAGIDTMEVDTVTDSDDDSELTRVTLGKNLSDRMTLKYRMEAKEGALVQKTIAEYQLLENILVSGFQDSNGIYGGALRYRIEFR